MKALPRRPSPRDPAPSRGRARPRPTEPVGTFTLGLRRRLRKVVSLLPAVLDGADPEVVHDLRVWTRRLQQGLDAAFPKPRPRRAKKARRRLRQVRRALGEWRNLDVTLGIVADHRRRSRQPSRRRAWALVARELRRQRQIEIERARQEVAAVDPRALERLVARLIAESAEHPPAALRAAVGQALDGWEAALATARASRRAEDLHALRIATKRLRYRAELSRDLGDSPPESAVGWAKGHQDRLGSWHDRKVLRDRVAAALARPDLLLDEPDALRAALDELERQKEAEGSEIDEILRGAEDPAVPAALRGWVAS